MGSLSKRIVAIGSCVGPMTDRANGCLSYPDCHVRQQVMHIRLKSRK